MEFLFRHKTIRYEQKKLLADLYGAISTGQHAIVHAPCGIGKTDASLSAAITYGMDHGKTIFFLTPKISQHRIAVDVVSGIASKHHLPLTGVDIIGRRYACIHPALSDLDYEGFYMACEKLRKEEACVHHNLVNPPSKQQVIASNNVLTSILDNYGHIQTHDQLVSLCEKHEACPYEVMMKLAVTSQVIICDYFHLISPHIRDVFLSRIKKKIKDLIIIVDEAHNVPARVRDYLSTSFNTYLFKKVEREMEEMGEDPPPFAKRFESWAQATLDNKREAEVGVDEIWGIVEVGVEKSETIDYFKKLGEEYVENTNKKSATLRLALFLEKWDDDAPAFRCVRKTGRAYSVSKKFLDPSLITSAFNDAWSTVFMSATLTPMEMYRDILGVDEERVVMKQYQSPFPRKNRLQVIVQGVSTKYSRRNPQMYRKIGFFLDQIYDKRTAVFFPSYEVMNEVLPHIHATPLYAQKQNMSPSEIRTLVSMFSKFGGMLCAVQGGSLSEGLDFSNNEIKTLVVVGVGLEEMTLETKALIDYYQQKFGRGWDYAYLYPAMTKALQSAGRAIRKESDKAAIIFLDERFAWSNYRRLFPPDSMPHVLSMQAAIKYVKEFSSQIRDTS